MNVTLKLPDDLVREARLRAVHDSKSLSAWMRANAVQLARQDARDIVSRFGQMGGRRLAAVG